MSGGGVIKKSLKIRIKETVKTEAETRADQTPVGKGGGVKRKTGAQTSEVRDGKC